MNLSIETVHAWGQRVEPRVGDCVRKRGRTWENDNGLGEIDDPRGFYLGNMFVLTVFRAGQSEGVSEERLQEIEQLLNPSYPVNPNYPAPDFVPAARKAIEELLGAVAWTRRLPA